MTHAATLAKQTFEQKLTTVAGRPVEITIRGERAFTFYFDGINDLPGYENVRIHEGNTP